MYLPFGGPREPLSRRRSSTSTVLELGLERRVSASCSGRQEMGQPQGRALHENGSVGDDSARLCDSSGGAPPVLCDNVGLICGGRKGLSGNSDATLIFKRMSLKNCGSSSLSSLFFFAWAVIAETRMALRLATERPFMPMLSAWGTSSASRSGTTYGS